MSSPKQHDFSRFAHYFIQYASLVRHVLVGQLIIVTLLGVALSYLEDLDMGEGIYFAYITGLSIGYGDITATSTLGRILCVVTGMVGMMFTGMTVAVANRALQATATEQAVMDAEDQHQPA
ncbi:MAG: potassium channel family protein [Rubripirellula sp.]